MSTKLFKTSNEEHERIKRKSQFISNFTIEVDENENIDKRFNGKGKMVRPIKLPISVSFRFMLNYGTVAEKKG